MSINKPIILIALIAQSLFANAESYQPKTLWEQAEEQLRLDEKKKQADKQAAKSSQSNTPSLNPLQSFIPQQAPEKKPDMTPRLVKVIIPWDGRQGVATIYYQGGYAPYTVGDFVPPMYIIKGIEKNAVSLRCIKASDKCIKTLAMTGGVGE